MGKNLLTRLSVKPNTKYMYINCRYTTMPEKNRSSLLLSGNLAGMGNWFVSHTMNVYHSSGGKAEHADKFGNTVHFEKTTAMISLPQMSPKN